MIFNTTNLIGYSTVLPTPLGYARTRASGIPLTCRVAVTLGLIAAALTVLHLPNLFPTNRGIAAAFDLAHINRNDFRRTASETIPIAQMIVSGLGLLAVLFGTLHGISMTRGQWGTGLILNATVLISIYFLGSTGRLAHKTLARCNWSAAPASSTASSPPATPVR